VGEVFTSSKIQIFDGKIKIPGNPRILKVLLET